MTTLCYNRALIDYKLSWPYKHLTLTIAISHAPACAWFLKIVSVWTSVCVCVCVPLRLLITSGATAFIWQLQLLSVVGVALELKCVVETNQIKE